MNWHPDLHLLADPAATRLAGVLPARTRILHLLRRSPVRLEPASPCPPVSRPLAERG